MIAMNLHTRFRLLMICMITLPVSMAVIMAIGVQYTKLHIRQAIGMDELVLNLHELQILNSEYVSTPSERVIQQWRTKYDQISKKLAKQRGIPDGVEDALNYLPRIFEPLIILPDAALGKEVFHKRFRSQAAATLNLESQRIMDGASDMSRREQEGIVPLLVLIGAMMFALMLLVSFATIAIMHVTTRHMLSSVNLLKDGATAIAGGSLGFQVNQRGNDELASLASAINQMSHSLMASYEDLQEQKVRLETEMAERQTIHENLTIKTDELGKEIKEHRRAEEALRESKERLSTLFHCSPLPIWEEDFTCVKERFDALRTEGVRDWRRYFEERPDIVSECVGLVRLLDVNETSVTFFQAGSKADLNRNLAHYFTDESLAVFKEELIALAEGGTSFESEILIRNLKGETQAIWFTLKVDPSRTEKLDRVLVSFFDITERKKAEEEKAKL